MQYETDLRHVMFYPNLTLSLSVADVMFCDVKILICHTTTPNPASMILLTPTFIFILQNFAAENIITSFS